jgi:hypothetical protein
MSATMPEPPGKEVFNAIVEQARAELAHARPQGPEPKSERTPKGIVLTGFTPEWNAYYELLSKRRDELQYQEGGAWDTWHKAAYAYAKAKQQQIGALTVDEANVIADYESGPEFAPPGGWGAPLPPAPAAASAAPIDLLRALKIVCPSLVLRGP